jgi:sec-independent protein translocase protein TatB
MRFVGQWAGKMKRMGREFQNQFNEALREAELEGVRKDIQDIMSTDPLADVKKEMSKVQTGLNADLARTDPARVETPAVAPVASPEASAEAMVLQTADAEPAVALSPVGAEPAGQPAVADKAAP